jgi:autotransporter-associated beta strand protein
VGTQQRRAGRETTRQGQVRALDGFRDIPDRLARSLAAVAVAGTIGTLLVNSTSALADGGAGGAGLSAYPLTGPTAGGAGGSDGAAGSAGAVALDCSAGGGGGGGGAGGGLGGAGTAAGSGGGAGGASGTAGSSGFDGGCGGGGGGGGNGGINGQTIGGPLTIGSIVSGGTGDNGGNGGDGVSTANLGGNGGGGGGGGAGGSAGSVTGASVVTISPTAVLTGGTGGIGGNAGYAGNKGSGYGSGGGNGGDGGAGIAFSTSGATLLNSGTIQGGTGGMPGYGGLGNASMGQLGSAGLGGAGVTGADLTVINSGSIGGGRGPHFGSQAGAIVFTGGSNVLTMSGGATLTGNLVIASGLLTLAQTSGNWTYGTAITGSGAVAITTTGANVVTLQGVSTYSGGTTVTAGSTLAIDNSQSIGSGAVTLESASTLSLTAPGLSFGNAIRVAGMAAISTSQDARITTAIVDAISPGGLIKTGPGRLILSGTSTFSGLTQVHNGVLQVDGSIVSSSQTSVSGGVLRGTGTVGMTQINSGGTFSPGALPGTSMTVAGNLAFQSGAIYLVQVSTLGMTSANVSGTAFLGGTVTVAASAGWQHWTVIKSILHAGALNGTFAGVNAPSGFDASLSYSLTDVTLTISGGFSSDLALSRNHAALVAAHDGYFYNGGAVPARFGAVAALTGDGLARGLTELSGETPTGAQQASFNAMTQFLGMLSDPAIEGRGGAASPASGFAEEEDARNAYVATGRKRSNSERDAYGMMTKAAPSAPTFEAHWSVWGAGFGGSQTTDGNIAQGSNSTTSRIWGVAAGADYAFSPQTTAGFALAGGGTNFSVVGGGGGRSDLVQLGGFVRHTVASAYVTAALAYGWQDVTTDRTVTVAGIDKLRGRFNANAYSARIEAGHRTVLPWAGGVGITPYAAAQVTHLDLPGYAESTVAGPAAFALSYAAKSVTAPRTELGLRSDKSFAVGDALLTLRGRAAWAHDFNTDRAASATFQSLPGASFVVNGATPAHDAALTTASAEMKFVSGISLAATFEGEFSEVTRSYAGKGVARYSW